MNKTYLKWLLEVSTQEGIRLSELIREAENPEYYAFIKKEL